MHSRNSMLIQESHKHFSSRCYITCSFLRLFKPKHDVHQTLTSHRPHCCHNIELKTLMRGTRKFNISMASRYNSIYFCGRFISKDPKTTWLRWTHFLPFYPIPVSLATKSEFGDYSTNQQDLNLSVQILIGVQIPASIVRLHVKQVAWYPKLSTVSVHECVFVCVSLKDVAACLWLSLCAGSVAMDKCM